MEVGGDKIKTLEVPLVQMINRVASNNTKKMSSANLFNNERVRGGAICYNFVCDEVVL